MDFRLQFARGLCYTNNRLRIIFCYCNCAQYRDGTPIGANSGKSIFLMLKGFHHRLVKWIVVDDQVCNIISFRYSMLLTITICSQLMSLTVPSFMTCCSMAQII